MNTKQAIEILERRRLWANDDEDTANVEGRIAAAAKARQEIEAFTTAIDALSCVSGWSHRKEKKMTELYAVWDSLDNEFQIGSKEEVEKLYAKAKDEIMECINDEYSGEDEKVLMLKVIKKAEIVLDEDNKDDPKEHGYDHWIKWQDAEIEPRPLTLEELNQMGGQPVWVSTEKAWRIVIMAHDWDSVALCRAYNTISAKSVMLDGGCIYDRPPRGEGL